MLCDHGPGARVSKKVLLFTNRDDPLAPGEDGRELVAQWREYRNVHGIDVVLLPLPRTTTTTTTTLREGGEGGGGGDDDDDEGAPSASSRRLREAKRPTIAELKNRVARSDLVEAHDVTAPDPDFLLQLKSVPGTVPVPRHWGRKRKYLQGKVGGSVHFGPVSVSDRCSHARGTHPIMCFVSSLPPSLPLLSLSSFSLSLSMCV